MSSSAVGKAKLTSYGHGRGDIAIGEGAHATCLWMSTRAPSKECGLD
jgi:hypothetical protein